MVTSRIILVTMAKQRFIRLQAGDRETMQSLLRTRTAPQRVVERVRIVLASADGLPGNEISRRYTVSRPTVSRWLDRYERDGLPGLLADRHRSGRPKQITSEVERDVIRRTLETTPKESTHWSTRLMARETGLHQTTISRIWRAHGLKPHRIKTFKLSKDPQFVEKLQAVVGLYLNPPERAVVFSVDEKSQIQALDRTQPGLPLKKGRAGTMTHDYKRHGTTTLFAALNVRTGNVVHECLPRHRAAEFLRFARKVVRGVPKDLDVYFILDNASTHRTPEVMRWLQGNPRVSFYFVPTSSSWANLVERLFSELTQRQLKRLVTRSVDDLESAITTYLDRRNENPKPFKWTASFADIMAKVQKANGTLATLH
jgi:transposase